MELVVKLCSVSAMKASECVPWCEITQKWYDLLTFLSAGHEHPCVAGQHLLLLLQTFFQACILVIQLASTHRVLAFLLFSCLHVMECGTLQNSGMYSQNVEVVKGDVYQYMTLPAAMQGWYDNQCNLTAS